MNRTSESAYSFKNYANSNLNLSILLQHERAWYFQFFELLPTKSGLFKNESSKFGNLKIVLGKKWWLNAKRIIFNHIFIYGWNVDLWKWLMLLPEDTFERNRLMVSILCKWPNRLYVSFCKKSKRILLWSKLMTHIIVTPAIPQNPFSIGKKNQLYEFWNN